MKYIMTLIWALLIGGALAYILSSMVGNDFNLTQTFVYAATVFIITLLVDAVLKVETEK